MSAKDTRPQKAIAVETFPSGWFPELFITYEIWPLPELYVSPYIEPAPTVKPCEGRVPPHLAHGRSCGEAAVAWG